MTEDKVLFSALETRPEVIPEAHWQRLKSKGAWVWPVGSRTISGASTSESDYDFLVLSTQPIPDCFAGFGCDLSKPDAHYEPSDGGFNSWRCGEVNYIATYSKRFAERFLLANGIAVSFKLTAREDRVKLFQAVLYNRWGAGKIVDIGWNDFPFVDLDDGIPF